MAKSVIIWASDIPGLEIDEEIIHPKSEGRPPEQDPKIIDWGCFLAKSALYFIGNGAEWSPKPTCKIEQISNLSRIIIMGKVREPSPWVKNGNLTLSIIPEEEQGYKCKLWFEDADFSPTTLEREWVCFAPKDKFSGKERTRRIILSLYQHILGSFTDYRVKAFKS